MRLVDIDDIRVMMFPSEEDDPSESDGEREYRNGWNDALTAINDIQPSAESIIRCKDCKHNPKYEWFGCPMSHLSEAQRPETAWCWKAERRTDDE